MSSPTLDPVEVRVLGCLIEKERLTPESYPLSLNSLTAACNQSTNRDPVCAYDESAVEAAAGRLRDRKLVTMVLGAGARVQKFRHKLLDHYQLEPSETAVLCVLLLRGAQTPGEIRNRTDRFHRFASLEEVENCLDGLCRGADPLVAVLPARPGQKERRYRQLLGGDQVVESPPLSGDEQRPAPASLSSRMETLEREMAELRDEWRRLREELAAAKSGG